MTVQFGFIEMAPESSVVKGERQAAEDCVAVDYVLTAPLHQSNKVPFFAEHITEQGRPLGCSFLCGCRSQWKRQPIEDAELEAGVRQEGGETLL